jgi:hypothetical protein
MSWECLKQDSLKTAIAAAGSLAVYLNTTIPVVVFGYPVFSGGPKGFGR